jgi:hypothetical protein
VGSFAANPSIDAHFLMLAAALGIVACAGGTQIAAILRYALVCVLGGRCVAVEKGELAHG